MQAGNWERGVFVCDYQHENIAKNVWPMISSEWKQLTLDFPCQDMCPPLKKCPRKYILFHQQNRPKDSKGKWMSNECPDRRVKNDIIQNIKSDQPLL